MLSKALRSGGFSLVELLVALTITLAIGLTAFQVFLQNERVFRNQNVMVELQQGARAVASQLADQLRMAGQGVPLYASQFDAVKGDEISVILPSSGPNRLDFRAGLSNAETTVTASPLECVLGTAQTLNVIRGTVFSETLGTTAPAGRFVYIAGPADNGMWAWVRAQLTAITSTTLAIIPRQAGQAGRSAGGDSVQGTADDVIRFVQPPTVSLEEAVSFSWSGTAIRRATAVDLSNPANPVWSAANEIGRNFTSLVFTYYDKEGHAIVPDTAESRLKIVRIDVQLTAQTSSEITAGDRLTFVLSFRTVPRNLRIG